MAGRCKDHDEVLWIPTHGGWRCLGHQVDRAVQVLELGEAEAGAFRAWLFSGCATGQRDDAIERYIKASYLEVHPEKILEDFQATRSADFALMVQRCRQDPKIDLAPTSPSEEAVAALVQVEWQAKQMKLWLDGIVGTSPDRVRDLAKMTQAKVTGILIACEEALGE